MRSTFTPPGREWTAYYERFPYFCSADIRDGCHPRILRREPPAEKAIVLVHGLTDSPYFMSAIASYFFDRLGYDVYLPLLHCHGLREPNGMKGVSVHQWKANVDCAVTTAREHARLVSIGGLSTGGTLSFYTAVRNPAVNGALYLFSAALHLAGGFKGDLAQVMLRHRLFQRLFDRDRELIGPNPYRYDRMDLGGAGQLTELMHEIDELVADFRSGRPFAKRVFAAHSEADATADIQGIIDLQAVSVPEQLTFFRIPATEKVSHASLVLRDPVYAENAADDDLPLEPANPRFDDMMDALAAVA